MHNTLTNLLPSERQRSLTREYALRIAVVAAMLTVVLTIAAGALLMPAYVFLAGSERTKAERLAAIDSAVVPADDAAFAARLATISKNVSALIALSKTPSISALLRETLSIARPGLTLSGFSYAPATAKTAAALTVTGIAATRETLRSYQLALQAAPFARSAALPVSAYAEDTDIPFTITITIAP